MDITDGLKDQDKFASITSPDLWNGTKLFSWNAPSTKELSQERLEIQAFDYNDIQQITFEKVLELMSSLHAISFEDQTHIGSLGINLWILENVVYPKIESKIIRKYLSSKKHNEPYYFFTICVTVVDFINYCKQSTQIECEAIPPEFFSSYIKDRDISENQAKKLRDLYKRCFPFQPPIHLKGKVKKRMEEQLHPLVKKYLDHLAHLGDMQAAIKRTANFLKMFLEYLCTVYVQFQKYESHYVPLYQVCQEHLEEYRTVLLRKVKNKDFDIVHASIIYYITRAFFAYLFQKKLISKDITIGTSPIRTNKKYHYREIPTDAELSTFFNLLCIYSDQPEHFQLAFGLMLYLGLRPMEVCQLSWNDVNLETRSLIVEGKSKKSHQLPIPDEIYTLFQKVIKVSHLDGRYLFHSNPRTFKYKLYGIYKVLSLMANWNYPGGLYLFRHTFVTKLSELACPPQLLMKLARHERPETTSLYIHRSGTELTDAIDRLSYFEEEM
ncbi:tyrosine-type recombinase/integrase [Brevibacillus fluminis]|nr:site-specific integrase [Brevibacillus fluminis]